MLASTLPDQTMRCESKPRLKYERDNTGPIEQQTHLEVHDHVMEMDVIDNERKGMHQGKQEERICGPSMEHLDSFVRNTGRKRDPVRLARCRAIRCQI